MHMAGLEIMWLGCFGSSERIMAIPSTAVMNGLSPGWLSL
jgi:hypothetical protein